jgi:hypothetical protein
MVREWTRSGLLEATQGARLGEELCVELRRTNPFLRAGLALFTGLIVAASVALILTLLDLRDDVAIAAITGLSALASIGLAEYVVLRFRCYRFGVEEALAVAAVVLLSIAGGELTSSFHVEVRGMPAIVALLIGSAGGFGLYRRFGFVYAACGGIVCAAAIPFQLDLSAATQRVLAAATIASVFVVARSKRLKYRDDYPGDEYGVLQAAAWAGVYAVLNVQLSGDWYRVDSVPWLAPARVGPVRARGRSDGDCLRRSPVAVERTGRRTPWVHCRATPRQRPRGSVGGQHGFRLRAARRPSGRRSVTSRTCGVGVQRRPLGWRRGERQLLSRDYMDEPGVFKGEQTRACTAVSLHIGVRRHPDREVSNRRGWSRASVDAMTQDRASHTQGRENGHDYFTRHTSRSGAARRRRILLQT